MAIGWLSLLKIVPWSDVVSNAPKVADGARKLWSAVKKRSPTPLTDAAVTEAATSTDQKTISAIESRVALLEAVASDLHAQMLASSEVIKSLADQNTQLVHRVETTRIRILWLSGALSVVGILTTAAWLFTLTR
jgi:amino acid transporter